MELRDVFVASVALTIGGMMVYTSVLNEGWCFQMKIARVIEESKGRDKARTFIGAIGSLMMLLGLYILITPWLASNWFQSDNHRGLRTDVLSPIAANAD